MSIEVAAFGELQGAVLGELSAATSSPQGEALWTRTLSTITDAVTRHDTINKSVAALEARGVDCSTVRAQHASWMSRIQELFRAIVRTIANNTAVQSAIDAAAAVAAYAQKIIGLGEAAPTVVTPKKGTWKKIVLALDPDRPRGTQVPSLAGFGSLGELGWVQLVVPALIESWPVILPILGRIASMVAVYFITDRAASAIESISGDVTARGKALQECLDKAKKFTDKEQSQQALNSCQNVSTAASGMTWLILGGAAGAFALLYYQGKRR